MRLDSAIESEIKRISIVYLNDARESDISHTERVVDYGRTLIQEEGGDETVIIPELYFHDTGWSKISFGPRGSKNNDLHMKYGSKIAKQELKIIGYDEDKIKKIAKIISIHDDPEKIFELNDLDATLCFEADFLDKYGIPGAERFFEFVSKEYTEDTRKHHMKCLEGWFRTKTGRKLARGLFDEMIQYIGERKKELK